MRLRYLIPFLAALLIHSLLAFSIRMDNAAVPLPMGDEMDAVEVDLVEAAPAAAEPVVETAPEPPQPEPVMEEPPAPPEPEPQPEPEVVEEPPPPAPEPEAMIEPAPVEPPPKPKPKSPAPQKPKASQSKPTTPTIATQPATNTGQPGGSGAPGSSGTSKARIRSNPNPEYPTQARKQRLEGTVMLSVSVSADGRPISVRIIQSSGHASLDQSALKTVSTRWRFVPATAAGIPFPSNVKVPVSFRLKN